MITKEEFQKEIDDALKNKPQEWRKGQFVFNYINQVYPGVGRVAQFKYGVDCFFNDDNIPEFIDCCYNEIVRSEINND
jgi:hypothetical protein